MIQRRGFAEHLGLFEYRENAVRLAVTVAAAVEPLAAAAVVAVVRPVAEPEPAAAAVAEPEPAAAAVAEPEPAAVVAPEPAAAAVAAGTGVSSVPCGTVPIQDSDSKERRLPCRQI